MTFLENLKSLLAREECEHEPNDLMVQQLRWQITQQAICDAIWMDTAICSRKNSTPHSPKTKERGKRASSWARLRNTAEVRARIAELQAEAGHEQGRNECRCLLASASH